MDLKSSMKYAKAVEFATKAHDGQVRKTSLIPKIVHPYGVSAILLEHGYSIDVAIAGLLHDVIEDCDGYECIHIQYEFGITVANYVLNVTELSKNIPWEERKLAYIEHVAKVDIESKAICAADKIHNLLSLYNDIKIQGLNVFNCFNASKDQTLWFYSEVYHSITENELEEIPIFTLYRDTLELVLEEVKKHE